MHLNLRSFCILLLATASAQTFANTTQSTLLTTSLVITEADGGRQFDDNGIGFRLGLGKFVSSNVLLELQVGFNDYSGNNADFQQFNAGVDANYLFFKDARIQPYIVLGTGIQKGDAGTANSETQNSYADIGFGIMHQVSPSGTKLRADMRIRRDFYDDSGKGTNDYDDFVAHIGFAFPFGKALVNNSAPFEQPIKTTTSTTKAPLREDKPKAESTAIPPSSDKSDTDRDGIKDIADFCPGTTAHAAVDINGCSRQQNGATSKAPTFMSAPQPKTMPAQAPRAEVSPTPQATTTTEPEQNQSVETQPVVHPHASIGTITFVDNTAVLNSQGKAIVAHMGQELVQQNTLHAEIFGGGETQRVRTLRAQAVVQHLQRYGISDNRITINQHNASTETIMRLQTQ